ncbi:MAG: 30S ribosomal protein S2 [Crocinitomix sp.]|nr:30S ribosomal protein S2 [Crocinitomix sp.]
MARATFEELLEAGVHFGHLKRKWNPYMAPYIFTEKKGIHIIDLNKTIAHLDQACAALKQIAKSGKKILFVATKKQAKDILEMHIKPTKMPYVVERWSGGMLTNFGTIRKAIRKMSLIDKMGEDGTMKTLSKRERLQLSRTRAKLDKNYGTISDMTRVPAAVFVIDVLKEHIAVKEANKLNIPTFAMVDTNSDPRDIDFIIPSNDDATKSIDTILSKVSAAIMEGLEERKISRDKAKASKEAAAAAKEASDAKAESDAKAAKAAKVEAAKAEAASAKAEAAETEAASAPTEEKK